MLTRKQLGSLRHDHALESRTQRADSGVLLIVILLAQRDQYSAYSLEETPLRRVGKKSGPLSSQRMIEWTNLQIDSWRPSAPFWQIVWKNEPISDRIQSFVQQVRDSLA